MQDGQILWVVLKFKPDGTYMVQGIYDSEEKAVATCKDGTYVTGPIALNIELPEEEMIWPGAYYPRLMH